MNIASDIQEFKELFAQWMEAETTPRQERRLSQLARSLKGKTADTELAKDISLVLTLDLIGEAPAEADIELQAEQFATFVEQTVQTTPSRRRHRFALWSAISVATASAAAVLLLVTSSPGPQTADSPSVSAPSAPAMAVAAKPQPEATQATPLPDTQPAQAATASRPLHKAAQARPAIKAPDPEVQTLEPREVTDPEEAALILSESCNLLASSISRAGEDTRQAFTNVTENINSIYSEI